MSSPRSTASRVDGLTVDATRDKIRGKKGTEVTLTIVRGSAAPTDMKVTRDVIISKEVVTKTLGNGAVGYIERHWLLRQLRIQVP